MSRQSPCGWNPDAPCSSGACCPTVDDPVAEARAKAIAAELLWRITGLRYGCCEVTARPCSPRTCKPESVLDSIYMWDRLGARDNLGVGVGGTFPLLMDGQTFNVSCGCKTGCCDCESDCSFFLPGPVCEIIDIVVGDVHLGKNAYTLYADGQVVLRNVGVQVNTPLTVPLPAGITEVSGNPLSASGCGVSLDTQGAAYDFEFPPNKQDVQFIIENPTGNLNTLVNIFQPQNFDWVVLSGGNPTITRISNSQIQIGPATVPDENVRILVRAPRNGTARTIVVQQVGPDPNPIRVCTIQWSDFTTGDGYCPPCQDYNKPLGESGTWSVTYTRGEAVPDSLNFAAGLYACELGKLFIGDASCAIPKNVQSIARQGFTANMPDPFLLAENGLTGVPTVDLIIRTLSPYGHRQPPRVWSPDLPRSRRQVQ